MTGFSNPVSVEPTTSPPAGSPATDRAAAALSALREATPVLLGAVRELDQTGIAQPSLLPGWTRGHVVTHLARNADALVNLLTSARTGIEHPAYQSRADRDADIAHGADRLARIQWEDLVAADERFHFQAARLGEREWATVLTHPSGRPMVAAEIPELRLFEVWTHLVDLDTGLDFTAVPEHQLDLLLDVAVRGRLAEADEPGLRLVARLPGGRQRSWALAITTSSGSGELAGSAVAVLSWLTGRGEPVGLVGDEVPDPGAWG